MTDRARVVSLQHVALPFPGTSESAAEARRFYGQVLGMPELSVPTQLGDGVLWFAAGDQEIHLYAEPSGVAVNEESTRHPCFQADDLKAARGHLTALGVDTIDGVPDIPDRPRFFVRDPFGNALEFVQLATDR